MDSLINIGIVVTYILLFVSVAGAILFPVVQTFGNLKKSKKQPHRYWYRTGVVSYLLRCFTC